MLDTKKKSLLGNRLLIKVVDETKTGSGLIYNENSEQIKKGEVVMVGEGRILENGDLIKIEAKIGDTVLCQYPVEIKVEGEKYQVVRVEDVLIVFNE